jgi:hypothetical protein
VAETTKKRISDLDAASQPLGGTELAEISQGGVSKKVTLTSIFGTGWWTALRAAFTSFVAPEATHATSADMSAACSGNSATASRADTATTALYGINFNYVIDSDAKLAQWATSGTWEKVLIKKGTWTLASGGVDLTARGTKLVVGEPGSKLVFSSADKGLYYTSLPTTNDYLMEGVTVETTSSSTGYGFYSCTNLTNCTGTGTGTGSNGYGFYSCGNLTNCTGSGTGTSDSGIGFSRCTNLTNCTGTGAGSNGYGFYSCTNLTNCTGTGTGTGSNGYGFRNCTNLTNCTGTGTGSNGYGFLSCTNLTNCTGTGTGSNGYGFLSCTKCQQNKKGSNSTTATYYQSYADAGTSYPCADTPNGGFNS